MPEEVDKMVKAVLDAVAASLRIELGGPSVLQPGQALAASISSFPQLIQTIKLVQAPFNLDGLLDPVTMSGQVEPVTHISKKVQFNDTPPEAELTREKLKDALKPTGTPIVLPTGAFASVPGVSGLVEQLSALVGNVNVSQLKGSITGALTVPLPIQVPVTAQVEWDILNDKHEVLTPGRDYLAPQGRQALAPTFILRPEITTDPSKLEPVVRYLRATIRLSADTYKTDSISRELRLDVLPLPLSLESLFSLSLDKVPEPGVPSRVSVVPPAHQIPSLPDVFALTWQKTHTHPAKLAIPLEIAWETFKYEASPTGPRETPIDSRYLQLLGQDPTQPLLSLLVQPNIVELADGLPSIATVLPDTVYVRAKVCLASNKTDPDSWIALPPLPLPVPTIAIPTVLALFNHAGFSLNTYGGIPPCALVVVPTHSLLRTAQPDELLSTLRGLLGIVNGLTRMPVRLPILTQLIEALGPLGRLVDTLGALATRVVPGEEKGPKLIIRATNEEDELDDILFFRHYLAGIIEETADNTFGSLLFVGPPGKSLRFYNNAHFDHEGTEEYDSSGVFNLRLPKGELLSFAAMIESLHGDPPATFPAGAFVHHTNSEEQSFGDRLSSFKFLPDDWLQVKILDFSPRRGGIGTPVDITVANPNYVDGIEFDGKPISYELAIPDPFGPVKMRIIIPEGTTGGWIKVKFRDLWALSEERFIVMADQIAS